MAQRSPERRLKMERIHRGWVHGEVRPLDIRSGDTVVVLTGRDKGKRGVVERTMVETQRLVVRGVNLHKRHTKAGVRGNVQGGIVDFDAPIHYSNVMLICNRCDKPTRIGHQTQDDGSRVMVCKKCGEQYVRGNA